MVSCFTLRPSASTTEMCSPRTGPEMKAIRLPSGDQRGVPQGSLLLGQLLQLGAVGAHDKEVIDTIAIGDEGDPFTVRRPHRFGVAELAVGQVLDGAVGDVDGDELHALVHGHGATRMRGEASAGAGTAAAGPDASSPEQKARISRCRGMGRPPKTRGVARPEVLRRACRTALSCNRCTPRPSEYLRACHPDALATQLSIV